MTIVEQATALMILSGQTYFSDCRNGHGMICQKEKAVVEKKIAIETCFIYNWFY